MSAPGQPQPRRSRLTIATTFVIASMLGVCTDFTTSAESSEPAGRVARPLRSVTPQGDRPADAKASGSSVTKTFGVLLLIVGGLLVAARFSKRFGLGPQLNTASGAIEVLERASVEGRQSIQLVRIGRRVLVLGNGPNGLTVLTEITDPDEVALLTQETASDEDAAPTARRFLSLLARQSGSEPTTARTDLLDRTPAPMQTASEHREARRA